MSRPIPTRLYLTGMPGSGKTTVGRLLADRLRYRFLDLDEETARLSGRSLTDLFREGEEAFRRAERRALEEAAGADRVVIATGGGALIDPEALSIAMRTGVMIYLRTPVAILARRLDGAAGRPLLLDDGGAPLSPESLEGRLESILQTRRPAYERADFVIDAADSPPESVVASIAARLGA